MPKLPSTALRAALLCNTLPLARVVGLRVIGTAFKPDVDVDQCGPIRFNYRCRGSTYSDYLTTNGSKLQSIYDKAAKQPFNRKVLFIGNSHMREVAEAFLCQRHMRIASWAHLTESGCLGSSPFATRCDGKRSSCTDDLARATLVDGGNVYMAINHPWIYNGIEGLKKAFDLLQVDISALDTVVVGAWNSDQWAVKKFVLQRAVPVCGGQGAFDHLGLQRFDTAGFAVALQGLGFKGQMVLGGQFGEEPVELLRASHGEFGFRISSLPRFPSACASPVCGPRSGHQCLPGPPDFVAAEVAAG